MQEGHAERLAGTLGPRPARLDVQLEGHLAAAAGELPLHPHAAVHTLRILQAKQAAHRLQRREVLPPVRLGQRRRLAPWAAPI